MGPPESGGRFIHPRRIQFIPLFLANLADLFPIRNYNIIIFKDPKMDPPGDQNRPASVLPRSLASERNAPAHLCSGIVVLDHAFGVFACVSGVSNSSFSPS